MELTVYNIKGEDTGRKVTLEDSIFAVEPNDHAIYLDVKQYLANQRQGTHKSKQRNEISGSTRKIKKQKGTGTARAGSIKSPVFRGGGRVFGPEPRDYSFKLNKKLKKLARKSALTYKVKNEELVVIENFNFEAAKTKEFVTLRENLKVADKKSLWVMPNNDKNVVLSARNLKNANVIAVSDLNTYQILDCKCILITESSIESIGNLLNA